MLILRNKLFAKKKCTEPDDDARTKIENNVKEDYYGSPKSKRKAVAEDSINKHDSDGVYHLDGDKPEGKEIPKKTKDKIMKEVEKSNQLKIVFDK